MRIWTPKLPPKLSPSQRPSPLHPLDLQRQILKADGVVAIHRALKLRAKDQARILAARTRHGPRRLGRFSAQGVVLNANKNAPANAGYRYMST